MAEPRLLKLQSPAYGEAIFYKWPLTNTVYITRLTGLKFFFVDGNVSAHQENVYLFVYIH